MQDELSALQHSEFTISEEIDRKHGAFAALQMIGNGNKMADLIEWGCSTEADIRKYQAKFEALAGYSVPLD